ncbi:hypothetical protein EGW08_023201 [Elysia chlorotica]|uniref:Uncharacterized protein n=1 Tax=Elysia chlorotica TaxID=188477 RepID=A0A433SJ40_ELYCH|nr:hypothetical protein EGW08_023201 [Elysia chlorotica]
MTGKLLIVNKKNGDFIVEDYVEAGRKGVCVSTRRVIGNVYALTLENLPGPGRVLAPLPPPRCPIQHDSRTDVVLRPSEPLDSSTVYLCTPAMFNVRDGGCDMVRGVLAECAFATGKIISVIDNGNIKESIGWYNVLINKEIQRKPVPEGDHSLHGNRVHIPWIRIWKRVPRIDYQILDAEPRDPEECLECIVHAVHAKHQAAYTVGKDELNPDNISIVMQNAHFSNLMLNH